MSTPLELAIQNDHKHAIKLLLHFGAKFTRRINLMSFSSDMLYMLVDHGYIPHKLDMEMIIERHHNKMFRKCLKHFIADGGDTARIVPAVMKHGTAQMVDLLVAYGLDVNSKIPFFFGYDGSIINLENNINTLKALLKYKPDLTTKNYIGNNPLERACACDSQAKIRILLRAGARIGEPNSSMAFCGVISHGNLDLVKQIYATCTGTRHLKWSKPLEYAREHASGEIVEFVESLMMDCHKSSQEKHDVTQKDR